MRSEIEITSNVFATEQDSMLIGSDFISIVGKWPVMWLDPADCIPAIEVTSRDLDVASILESKLKIPWKWEFEIENLKTWSMLHKRIFLPVRWSIETVLQPWSLGSVPMAQSTSTE